MNKFNELFESIMNEGNKKTQHIIKNNAELKSIFKKYGFSLKKDNPLKNHNFPFVINIQSGVDKDGNDAYGYTTSSFLPTK